MTTRTIPIRPRSWPLLLLACSLASRAHADSAPPDGMEVLLFREQALVTRTRPLACRPGASGRIVVRFDRLPAAADRHSVRAQGRGATVAGVRLIEIDGQSEASAARAARLAALDRQIAVARDVRNRLVLRDVELASYQSTVTGVIERQLRRDGGSRQLAAGLRRPRSRRARPGRRPRSLGPGAGPAGGRTRLGRAGQPGQRRRRQLRLRGDRHLPGRGGRAADQATW